MTNENAVKTMSLKKKALIVLCALVSVVVIVATSVLATVALLTSSATVTNTFTIGNVGITLKESKVNPDGTLFDDGATKVDANIYNLVPNTTYVKDPTITVTEGSENSYLFVTIRNDLTSIAANDPGNDKPTIAYQLKERGWAKYAEVATGNVYVYVGDHSESMDTDGVYVAGSPAECVNEGTYQLFDTFSIKPDADVSAFGAAEITIRAFAIQDAGLSTVADAWAAVLQHYPYIHTGNTSASN